MWSTLLPLWALFWLHKLAGHDVRKVNNGHLYCNTCKHGRMVW